MSLVLGIGCRSASQAPTQQSKDTARALDAAPLADSVPPSGIEAAAEGPPRERDLAGRWLAALRVRDRKAIADVTAFPFTLRDAVNEGTCQRVSVASKQSSLASTIKCLLESDWLYTCLEANPTRVPQFMPVPFIPEWAKPWAETMKDARVFDLELPGPGCDFDLYFLVAQDGVRTVWKRGSVIGKDDIRPATPFPGAPRKLSRAHAERAKAWMAALRSRDVATLPRLTRYPFVLHDTGKFGQVCEGVRADGPDSMTAVLDCFNDEFMREALGMAAFDVVGLHKTRLPRWAKKWRNEIAPGLEPVGLSVLTDGVLWDMILLVGDVGIGGLWRAAWVDPH